MRRHVPTSTPAGGASSCAIQRIAWAFLISALTTSAHADSLSTTSAALPAPEQSAKKTTDTSGSSEWDTGVPVVRREWAPNRIDEETEAKRREMDSKLKRELLTWDSSQSLIMSLPEQRIQLHASPQSYLKIDIAVEASDSSIKDLIEVARPVLDEEIQATIHSITPSDLYTLEGKLVLKRRLLRSIDRIFPTVTIRNVYLTTFTILSENY